MIHDSLLGSFRAIAFASFCLIAIGTIRAEDIETMKLVKTFVDEFVSITPGTGQFPASFEMGRNDEDPSERPRHTVTFSRAFAMAKYEVPQNLYEAVMGSNPGRWKGPRNSVEMMSWDDANQFCHKVTQLAKSQKLIGHDETIRLPTEAEWEYCCRAGTTTRYSFGDTAQKPNDISPKASILNDYAWHTGNAAGNDPPIGALKPNPWGLYDMHGYLWEFTADAWSPSYEQAPTDGSSVNLKSSQNEVVIRGGSWKDSYNKLTSTARRRLSRTDKDDAVGFRCVRSK
jgi:formylglycine-generating enzyme required for sulfatase activity